MGKKGLTTLQLKGENENFSQIVLEKVVWTLDEEVDIVWNKMVI